MAAPSTVFIVFTESAEGVRGVYAVCATDFGASTRAREASNRHARAWYEPMRVEG